MTTGSAALAVPSGTRRSIPPRGWAHRAIRRRGTIIASCVLVAVACVTLLPFYWMVS